MRSSGAGGELSALPVTGGDPGGTHNGAGVAGGEGRLLRRRRITDVMTQEVATGTSTCCSQDIATLIPSIGSAPHKS